MITRTVVDVTPYTKVSTGRHNKVKKLMREAEWPICANLTDGSKSIFCLPEESMISMPWCFASAHKSVGRDLIRSRSQPSD